MLHEAVRGLPLSVPAAQMGLPFSVKVTLPVGIAAGDGGGEGHAACPPVAGLPELASVVVVAVDAIR